ISDYRPRRPDRQDASQIFYKSEAPVMRQAMNKPPRTARKSCAARSHDDLTIRGLKAFAVTIILVLLGVYVVDNHLHARYSPGVLAPSEPYQGSAASGVAWNENGNQFIPLADFHLRARILRTESYWLDRGSVISPLDLTEAVLACLFRE